MTAVKISGTFKKDGRPDNGLESVSEILVKDEMQRHVVVGIVEVARVSKERGEEPIPTVKFVAIEPLHGDAEEQGRQMLDHARKLRGLGQVELTLFDAGTAGDGPDRDPTAGPWPGDADYKDDATTAADDGPSSERVRDEWLDDGPGGATPTAPAPKTRRRNPPPSPFADPEQGAADNQ